MQENFVYQPTLAISEFKKCKGTDYVLTSKSKGVYNSKLKPAYTASLHSIKPSEYTIGIKYDKEPLAVEQNNILSKIVNTYIIYDLDDFPRNPTNSFKFRNCLIGATNVVKNSNSFRFKNCLIGATNVVKKSGKEKYVYSAYGTTFDSASSWSFGNDFARNVIIFGFDDS